MELPDKTIISHSEILERDGKERVRVYMEKPIYGGFATATCWLPDYRWEDVKGFSQKDIDYFSDIIHSGALQATAPPSDNDAPPSKETCNAQKEESALQVSSFIW